MKRLLLVHATAPIEAISAGRIAKPTQGVCRSTYHGKQMSTSGTGSAARLCSFAKGRQCIRQETSVYGILDTDKRMNVTKNELN